ncbi:MAG: hypothetical protein KDB63_08925 [Nocardioidaceae bacterium]|nr:hypothetical protein [Nocardioidaceae bacterium]
MTTETLRHTPNPGLRVLLGAAWTGLVAGGVVVLVAALTGPAPALWGALVGAGMALGTFAGGSLVVDLVAGRMPAASLLVAVLTYTLEVVLLGLVFWQLDTSGTLGDSLSGGWLGAAVIAVTIGWLVGQIVLTARARIPAFDLPSGSPSAVATGGER